MDVDQSPSLNAEVRPAQSWRASFCLGIGLFLVYSANLHTIPVHDADAGTLLPIALIRGDGLVLDRFESFLLDPATGGPDWHVERWRGHLVSRYPAAPALLMLPFDWPQVMLLDRLRPGWDRGPQAHTLAAAVAKNSAAAIAALTGSLLLSLLWRLGFGRVAWAATLAAALGSDIWAVSSQAAWQQGPATLALVVALWAVVGPRVRRGGLFLCGLATATLVACRSIDVVFAAALGLWILRYHPRRLGWFVPMPILIGSALVAYNMSVFGHPAGGYARLEELHETLHAAQGSWSGDGFDGVVGTLLSPARGLFVYTPWALLALLAAPAAWRRLRPGSPVQWALCGLLPFGVVVAQYKVWWAGHTFGPRYWIDAVPLLAVLLAGGLDWARGRGLAWRLPFAVALAWSIAVQAIGAACYPSSWNTSPNVDTHHERLWDWRDTELSRSLNEGVNPRLRQAAGALARRLGMADAPAARR